MNLIRLTFLFFILMDCSHSQQTIEDAIFLDKIGYSIQSMDILRDSVFSSNPAISSEALFNLGVIQYQNGQNFQALSTFQELIKKYPNYIDRVVGFLPDLSELEIDNYVIYEYPVEIGKQYSGYQQNLDGSVFVKIENDSITYGVKLRGIEYDDEEFKNYTISSLIKEREVKAFHGELREFVQSLALEKPGSPSYIKKRFTASSGNVFVYERYATKNKQETHISYRLGNSINYFEVKNMGELSQIISLLNKKLDEVKGYKF